MVVKKSISLVYPIICVMMMLSLIWPEFDGISYTTYLIAQMHNLR